MASLTHAFRAVAAAALAAAVARADSIAPDLARAAAAVLPSAVRVSFQPKLVDLEEPVARIMDKERCPNCGNYHSSDLSSQVKMEADSLSVGFLLAPDKVICRDKQLGLENIGAVSVTLGAATVPAAVEAVYADQDALLLKLEKPLPAAAGAGVSAAADKPAVAVSLSRDPRNPLCLVARAAPLQSAVAYAETGAVWAKVDAPAALLDAQGRVCGFAFNDRWLASDVPDPSRWASYSKAELERRAAEARAACAKSVLPVTLSYRSPRMSRNNADFSSRFSSRGRDDESGNETELNTSGVMVSDRRLFVRIGEDRKRLVRLEHIKVAFPGGAVEAKFVCALAHMQGLIAELPAPRPEAVLKVSLAPAEQQLGKLAFLADVSVSGQGKLRIRTAPLRVSALDTGWRNHLTTDLPVESERNVLVFSPQGECLWWNTAVVTGEDSIGEEDRHWSRSSESQCLPAAVLAELSAPAERDVDAAASPSSPLLENRLGWLGFDLQPMTRELAESKGVMADTENGKFGALVTRVYADSPAAKAGVKDGWVLLSIRQSNQQLPMKVGLEETDAPYRSGFPWNRLDEVPAEYMDQLPTPWPSAANSFVNGLTRLGIGAQVQAAFVADGKKSALTMAIAMAPPTYESAPSFKWKAAGISVCDLTYEVRDYLGLAANAPGVVISRVESGGKAVTAGIRPFEVITQFNGKAVFSAAEVEKLAAGATDVRLDVKRMTRDRVVAFSLPPAK